MSILVTGANAGIGLETAAALASAGHSIILAGRRPAAIAAAVADLRARPGIRPALLSAAPAPLDLSSPASVAAFSDALAAQLAATGQKLAVLVNNAGIAAGDAGGARPTAGGGAAGGGDAWPVSDPLMATNALGTHALTRLLLPLLLASGATPPRVVTLSSRAHRGSPRLVPSAALAPGDAAGADDGAPLSDTARYCRSKLANALFAAELARRVNGGGTGSGGGGPRVRLLSAAVSPGFVRTGLASSFAASLPLPGWAARALTALLAQSPAKGSRTSVWCATAPAGEVCGGGRGERRATATPPGFSYAHDARPALGQLSAQACDVGLAADLFEAQERVIADAGVVLPALAL